MNKMQDDHIIITDDNGVESIFKILFTYDNEDRNFSYVLFYSEENPEDIIAMKYNDDGELFEIESDEEYDEVEEVLNTYLEDPEISKNK